MKTNTHLLLFTLIFSTITGAMLAAQVAIPPVYAGEPPGDSILRLRCEQISFAGTVIDPDCVGDTMQPKETVVYDVDRDGVYDTGETVIGGAVPNVGITLKDDPRIKFFDSTNNNVLDATEGVVYDRDGDGIYDRTATVQEDVIRFPQPANLAALEDDANIKYVDSNGNGVWDITYVRITGRVENLGGTDQFGGLVPNGNQEDADGIQFQYTYNPSVLTPKRSSAGALLPDGNLFTLIPVRQYCNTNGFTVLDTIAVNEVTGTVSASHGCLPPSTTADVGLGCDESYTNTGECLGQDFTAGTFDPPLQSFDALRLDFVVTAHAAFIIDLDSGASFMRDIDGVSSANIVIPAANFIDTSFDNTRIGTHDVAVTGLAVKETPARINVDVQNQGTAGQAAYTLYGEVQGWGFTAGSIASPGPDLVAAPGGSVDVTLNSADGVRHNFFVDYNANGVPDTGEPLSPDFGGAFASPITYGFTATTTPGTYTYRCEFHPSQFGSFIVGALAQEVHLQVTLSPADTQGTSSFSSVHILMSGETATASFPFSPAAGQTYTITADVSFKEPKKTDADPTDNTRTISYTPPVVKVPPTAVIVAPDKTSVKDNVLYDGSTSHDNNVPPQTLTYKWTDASGATLGTSPTLFQTLVTYTTPGSYTVNLEVCNTSLLCDTTSHTITINAIKTTPTAVISGPTKANVKEQVTFDGSGSFDSSNPVQTIVSYTWHNEAGDVIGTGPTLSQTYMTPGTYTIHLQVCNESGLCGGVFHTITINAIKNAPTAAVTGPTEAFVKADVTFDASGSVDNSNPVQSLTYSWSVDGGASLPGSATFTTSFMTTGPHTVTVTVCNTSLLCDEASHTITINAIKNIPTAAITGPSTGGAGDPITFDGSDSFDTSNPVQTLTYAWSVDGTPTGITTPTLTYTFTTSGPHTVLLTVCNQSGLCDDATHTIDIIQKSAPTAVITGPTKANVKESVTFDGSTSSDSNSPPQSLTYAWSVDGVSTGVTTSTLQYTFTTTGPHTVTLTVCNTSGLCDEATHSITINAIKTTPTAIILGPSTGALGEPITFDGSTSSDTSNPPQTLTYEWMVDGSATGVTTSTLTHTFDTAGPHTVTLTVCNTSGLCNTATHTIEIIQKTAPTAVVTGPDKAFVKEEVMFDGSTSSDSNSPPQSLTYAWSVDSTPTGVTTPTLTRTFTTTGTHTVTLTVCNTSGLCGIANHNVTINPIKAAPTAVISAPAKGFVSVKVLFDGTGSRDNSNPPQSLFYAWTDAAGNLLGNQTILSLTFNATGTFTIQLEVCNTSGMCDTASHTIQINPAKQALVLDSFTVSPVTVFVSEERAFTAAYTGGTGPFTCTFDFGDGTSTTVTSMTQSCSTTHVYTTAGTFTASVTITGQNPGDNVRATLTITVHPEPRFFRGKLSWKHHLLSPNAQSFSGKAANPSTLDLLVRIDLRVSMPNGQEDFCTDEALADNCSTRSFMLTAGTSNTDMAFTYTPGDALGKYCFDATLVYGMDMNGDLLLTNDEILGTDNVKSGCFNYV